MTGSNQKSKVLSESIKVNLSRGGNQRMITQDDDALSMLSREPFQPNTQIDFFAGKELFAEPSTFAKRCGIAKDKRAGHP